MAIKKELLKLKEIDVWSLLLFTLFKMRDIPEFASLSELVYLLPKDSLLNLCKYYGGMTISIPTIDELENLVYVLLLYNYVNIEKVPYDDAIKNIGFKSSELRKVKANYDRVCSILDNYEFKQRT